MTKIYDFSIFDQNNRSISLEIYKGDVLLIVNTATGCGLTPQYKGLQYLYTRYQNQGFEILDFPCNQFMGQAPGTAEEINRFCSLHYQTTFPRFAKVKVNGKEADPGQAPGGIAIPNPKGFDTDRATAKGTWKDGKLEVDIKPNILPVVVKVKATK